MVRQIRPVWQSCWEGWARERRLGKLTNSTKRPMSFLAQMGHSINGMKPPRPKLHRESCSELLETLAQMSTGAGTSAVLPRAHWNNAPALLHPPEVCTPSGGPLQVPCADADPMAPFHNKICLPCTGRAAPARCLLGLAAGLQGTNSPPHTFHSMSLPRAPASGWFSLSSQGQWLAEKVKECLFIIFESRMPLPGLTPRSAAGDSERCCGWKKTFIFEHTIKRAEKGQCEIAKAKAFL